MLAQGEGPGSMTGQATERTELRILNSVVRLYNKVQTEMGKFDSKKTHLSKSKLIKDQVVQEWPFVKQPPDQHGI